MRKNDVILLFIIIAGAVLRILLVGMHRFHGDEALYSTWALFMAKHRTLFVIPAFDLDKPPFYIFASALSWLIFPVKEIFAEIPNIAAGILSIYFLYKAGYAYFENENKALASAMIFSLMPVNIMFSATAFTDPMMVCFVLAATYYFLKKEFWKFGILFGIAAGTKQFALFFVPFYVFFVMARPDWRKGLRWNDIKATAAGFFLTFSVAFLWGVANSIKANRHALFAFDMWFGLNVIPVIFKTGVSDAVSRLASWVYYYKMIFVSGWISTAVWLLIILSLAIKRDAGQAVLAFSLVFILYALSAVRTPVYEHYTLTFAPFTAMLAGSSAVEILKIDSWKKLSIFCALITFLFIFFPLRDAYNYKAVNLEKETYGAFYTRNDGLDTATEFVSREKTLHVIIYMHRDFAWCLDYYLNGIRKGYSWTPINDDSGEKPALFAAKDLKQDKACVYLMFYTNNDLSSRFAGVFKKHGLVLKNVYKSYNRFGKESIIVYRVLGKGGKV